MRCNLLVVGVATACRTVSTQGSRSTVVLLVIPSGCVIRVSRPFSDKDTQAHRGLLRVTTTRRRNVIHSCCFLKRTKRHRPHTIPLMFQGLRIVVRMVTKCRCLIHTRFVTCSSSQSTNLMSVIALWRRLFSLTCKGNCLVMVTTICIAVRSVSVHYQGTRS